MDKKQLGIIGGIAAGVIVIMIVFKMMSGGGEATPTADTKTEATKDGAAGGGVMIPGAGGMSSGGGTKGTSGADAKSAGAFTPPDPKDKPNFAKLGTPRPDPFFYDWRALPPPPNVFDSVEPIRIASPSITAPPTQPVEIRETPSRRFAGFMNGDGVYAILEGGGETEIVQPGSLTSDGFKVVSITTENVLLRKVEGNVIRVQQVAYGDAPPTAVNTARAGNAVPAGGASGFAPGGNRGGTRRGGGSNFE